MRAIVLGSGLLGVSSAYYLSRLGHEVSVIDRQASPAAETSFANGGQISVSHAEPTPSNVPIIGKSKLPNLFLNTGHGTLGWTHSCGSGKSIARIMSGLEPEVDFAFS